MKYVFSIFDKKSNNLFNHFISNGPEDARRAMITSLYSLLVRNEDSPFITFPDDYSLGLTAFVSDYIGEKSDTVDDKSMQFTDLLSEAKRLYKQYLDSQE